MGNALRLEDIATGARRSPFRRTDARHVSAIEDDAVKAGYVWLAGKRGERTGWERIASFDLYAIPVQAPKWILALAAEYKCTVMGVVPHYRVVGAMRLAFFPEGTAPQPRQRLRIEDGHSLLTPKPVPGSTRQWLRDCVEIIHIDEWTPLKPESLYLDSDVQPCELFRFYQDHLRVDDHLLLDLLLPSTSASYGIGGGIDLGGRVDRSSSKAAGELLWQLSVALPPEYRHQAIWPSDAKGVYRQGDVGKFFFQDLPPPSSHSVMASIIPGSSAMQRVLHRRPTGVESSAYAALSIPQGTRSHVKLFLDELTTPHCILPEPLDDLLRMDLDMTGFEREVSSSVWKAHVLMRDFQPLPGNIAQGVVALQPAARDALDLAFIDLLPKEQSRRRYVRRLMRTIPHRLEETAIALARLRGTNATKSDTAEAFRLLDTNITKTLEHEDFRRAKLELAEEVLGIRDDYQEILDIFETVMLGSGPMHPSDIIESVLGSPGLETSENVMEHLERLDQNGYAYKQPDQRYVWIDI